MSNGGEQDIQINSEWNQERNNDIFAPWEELIRAIIDDDITRCTDVPDHQHFGSIALETATENLYKNIDEIESREHATAMIKTLLEKDIIDKNDKEVVLFQDISGELENPNHLYNWAAAAEMCRNKIDEQVKRAEKLDKQLLSDLEQIDSTGQEFAKFPPREQIDRIDQKIRTLGKDPEEVPRNPEELSPAEQRKFNQYKRTFMIARIRKRLHDIFFHQSRANHVTEKTLPVRIRNVRELEQTFVEYERILRRAIQFNKWNNENVKELLSALIDVMNEFKRFDQNIDIRSLEKMDETLLEITESIRTASNAREEINQIIKNGERIDNQDEKEFRRKFQCAIESENSGTISSF